MQLAHLNLEKLSGPNGGHIVMRLNGKLSLETVQSSAVIQVAGLTKLLPIHNTVAEALAQPD